MNIPENIISQQTSRVSTNFLRWEPYMEENVEFWKIPGELDIHTQGHCERVLMHAMRIGDERKVTDRQLEALAFASIFHDTRRKDNYLDTGHGQRAADYYRDFCKQNNLEYYPETYAAIWYHDRDDELGEKYIRDNGGADSDKWLEVYHIFKDADALDRLRLGTWCLDPKYLRTDEAKGMMDFAQQLVNITMSQAEREKVYKLTDQFKPKQNKNLK